MSDARFLTVASRKLSTLRAGGWPLFQQKTRQYSKGLRSLVVWLAHSWWTLPIVLLIRSLQPVLLIRTGPLYGAKIGHFVLDSAGYYADSAQMKEPRKTIELFWIQGGVSNRAWLVILRRYLRIHWWVKYLDQTNRLIPLGATTQRVRHINGSSRDIHGMLAKADPVFQLTQHERKECTRWLRARGWSGEKLVCLHVRDELFHESRRHSYRNSNIAAYDKAINLLLSSGFWVVRTGREACAQVTIGSDRIIDYPFCPDKTDLLDIFLFSNSSLVISTGSGPDAIATVFGVPTLFVNFLPLSHIQSYSYSLTAPKHLVWKHSGKHLTIREYLRNRDLYTADYERSGIEIRDLSADEILRAVEEMIAYVDANSREPSVATDCSIQLQTLLREIPEAADLHSWVHPKAGIARSFLTALERKSNLTQ